MEETGRGESTRTSFLEFVVSAMLWGSCLVTFTFATCLYLLVSLMVSPRALNPMARSGCRLILWSAGQRLRVRGSFPSLEQGPYIYVFNHTSLLDTFVMAAVLPEFFGAVGKREQFDLPLWGWVIRRWGAVPIDRHRLREAIRSLDEVERTVSDGRSLLIAPEGTRSPDGTLGVFRKGPFHVALNTGASVVPLYVQGAYRSKSKGSWLFRPGVISVRVLEPVVVTGEPRPEVGHLVEQVRERFIQAVDAGGEP